ncbi:hypothetical protein X743_17725 [Mesorhizobium sp. LNHC252B00]|nr:hypothetical protein X743_17725 [Mesorhizobium sp. LNHC252B00]
MILRINDAAPLRFLLQQEFVGARSIDHTSRRRERYSRFNGTVSSQRAAFFIDGPARVSQSRSRQRVLLA